jgi:flagellar hook-associated protein 2
MASTTSSIFTGSSTYSNDFSQVITRAQKIASLPITLLENQKSALTAEQNALNTLSTSISALQAAVIAFTPALSGANATVSYSDSAVAAATASAGVLPGVYNLQVIDPGSQARATSAAAGIADPTKSSLSPDYSYSLTANGKTYSSIIASSNTLTSLAEAINTSTKGEVRATVVNLGTSAAPSYQLNLQNTKYGDLPITLDNGLGGPNLLGTPTSGTAVKYRVNGQPAAPAEPITSDSRTLTIAPNLTISVLAAGTTDITVSSSIAATSSALAGFVQAYNAVTKTLDAHRGAAGGALAGQSIVGNLSLSLREIANYSGSGSISSLVGLGLTFDQNGVLSFDSAALTAAAAKDPPAVTDFLGNPKTGGFLKSATDTLNSIADSASGVVPVTLSTLAGEISQTGLRIAEQQERVDELTESLNAQMAAADALIASLQQQATYFANMFAAMLANQNGVR